jgi:hypothetical protein
MMVLDEQLLGRNLELEIATNLFLCVSTMDINRSQRIKPGVQRIKKSMRKDL